MKKLTLGIMAAFMMLSFAPTQLKAATEPIKSSTVVSENVESTDADAQLARLEEIKGMDMSNLDRSEKKELRKEVRSIKNDQDGRGRRNHDGRLGRNYNGNHGGGAIYLSVGGGLVLVLLIILLL